MVTQFGADLFHGFGLEPVLLVLADATVRCDVSHDALGNVVDECHLDALVGVEIGSAGDECHHGHAIHVIYTHQIRDRRSSGR